MHIDLLIFSRLSKHISFHPIAVYNEAFQFHVLSEGYKEQKEEVELTIIALIHKKE